MIKLVVVDDVQKAREVLVTLINKFCRNVEIVATADSVKSGAEVIKQYQPDIVLLDIKMKDGSGFDLLNKCQPINFQVIFISAYDEYALKAFKFNALDYLLKPIDSNELIEAIQKAENAVKHKLPIPNKSPEIHEVSPKIDNRKTGKIILKTLDSIYFVNIKDIIRCESDDSYTKFFLNDGQKILITRPLKEYDELLSEFGFFRTHQSHLINLDYFVQFKKTLGGFAIMKDGTEIPVSSRKKDLFLQYIESL